MNIEEKIVFAVAPEGQGDGVPVIMMGIPAGAWNYMQDGKTHTFDLTKAGVRAKLVLFGAQNHADARAALEAAAFASGADALDDQTRTDFSIQPKG